MTLQVLFSRDFVSPFIFSVKDIVKSQFAKDIRDQSAFVAAPGGDCPGVAGSFVEFQHEGVKASVGLYFSEGLARAVYEAWAGEEPEAIDDEVAEVLREVLNMVYGQAKTVIKDLVGIELGPVVPTSSVGEELARGYAARKPAIAVPFKSGKGDCQLELSLVARSQR